MVVAATAILISVVSLVVTVGHGRTMEKLVAANSWPLLRYDTGIWTMRLNFPSSV
jgi:hypothetical protein